MPTTKAERWERTHRALLVSAGRLMRRRGLSLPTVAEVMEGARLTVGGFYGHWPSKEALFDEVLRGTFAELRGWLLAEQEGAASAELLTDIVRRYLSRAHRDGVDGGCALPSSLSDIAVLGEPYSRTLGEELDAFAAELGKLAGGAGGKELALGLVALMVGGLTLARATRGTGTSDAVLKASRALAQRALAGR